MIGSNSECYPAFPQSLLPLHRCASPCVICPPNSPPLCRTPRCPCFQSLGYFLPSVLSFIPSPSHARPTSTAFSELFVECSAFLGPRFLSEALKSRQPALSPFLNCRLNLTSSFFWQAVILLKLLFHSASTHPTLLPPSASFFFRASFALSPHLPLISQKSQLRLIFDHSPWELFVSESQGFYLCCVTIQRWKRPRAASQHGCLRPKCAMRRRRKPNLSSIHHGKIAPHLLIIAFFRLKGWRLNRQSCKHERCSCCRN